MGGGGRRGLEKRRAAELDPRPSGGRVRSAFRKALVAKDGEAVRVMGTTRDFWQAAPAMDRVWGKELR